MVLLHLNHFLFLVPFLHYSLKYIISFSLFPTSLSYLYLSTLLSFESQSRTFSIHSYYNTKHPITHSKFNSFYLS